MITSQVNQTKQKSTQNSHFKSSRVRAGFMLRVRPSELKPRSPRLIAEKPKHVEISFLKRWITPQTTQFQGFQCWIESQWSTNLLNTTASKLIICEQVVSFTRTWTERVGRVCEPSRFKSVRVVLFRMILPTATVPSSVISQPVVHSTFNYTTLVHASIVDDKTSQIQLCECAATFEGITKSHNFLHPNITICQKDGEMKSNRFVFSNHNIQEQLTLVNGASLITEQIASTPYSLISGWDNRLSMNNPYLTKNIRKTNHPQKVINLYLLSTSCQEIFLLCFFSLLTFHRVLKPHPCFSLFPSHIRNKGREPTWPQNHLHMHGVPSTWPPVLRLLPHHAPGASRWPTLFCTCPCLSPQGIRVLPRFVLFSRTLCCVCNENKNKEKSVLYNFSSTKHIVILEWHVRWYYFRASLWVFTFHDVPLTSQRGNFWNNTPISLILWISATLSKRQWP